MAITATKITTIAIQKDNFVIATKNILKKKNIIAAITSIIIISYIGTLNFCIINYDYIIFSNLAWKKRKYLGSNTMFKPLILFLSKKTEKIDSAVTSM